MQSYFLSKLKTFPEKVTQSVKIYFIQNFGIITFSEDCFGATMGSKPNVVSILKEHFSTFCKFLSDELQTISWESHAKCEDLFQSKFGHQNLLRKWFWSNLGLKTECCQRFKRAFFSFFQVFVWQRWNHFLRKWGKASNSILIKIWA